jgi:hypothetical protein
MNCLMETQSARWARTTRIRPKPNCAVLFQRRDGISVDRTEQHAMFIQMVGEYTVACLRLYDAVFRAG